MQLTMSKSGDVVLLLPRRRRGLLTGRHRPGRVERRRSWPARLIPFDAKVEFAACAFAVAAHGDVVGSGREETTYQEVKTLAPVVVIGNDLAVAVQQLADGVGVAGGVYPVGAGIVYLEAEVLQDSPADAAGCHGAGRYGEGVGAARACAGRAGGSHDVNAVGAACPFVVADYADEIGAGGQVVLDSEIGALAAVVVLGNRVAAGVDQDRSQVHRTGGVDRVATGCARLEAEVVSTSGPQVRRV